MDRLHRDPGGPATAAGTAPGRQSQHAHRDPAVIGLGLRLVLSGGREAVTRLVVLAVAVGVGVGLLLTAVAATNAAVTWNNRHGWFWTGTSSVPAGPARGHRPAVVGPQC